MSAVEKRGMGAKYGDQEKSVVREDGARVQEIDGIK